MFEFIKNLFRTDEDLLLELKIAELNYKCPICGEGSVNDKKYCGFCQLLPLENEDFCEELAQYYRNKK